MEKYVSAESGSIFRDEILQDTSSQNHNHKPLDENTDPFFEDTRKLSIQQLHQQRKIAIISGQGPSRTRHQLPDSLSPVVQNAISDSKDVSLERERVAASIASQLQLSKNSTFEHKARESLIQESGIKILRRGNNGEIEGILPKEISMFLVHGYTDCYIRLRGNEAEIISLQHLNGYVPGEKILDTSIPVLAQLMTGVTNHKKIVNELKIPLPDIYANLWIYCKNREKIKNGRK
ncbi:hypothetical protein GW846_01270 [Candidatus Gracilibacteria bacterium]|nr:hypothetical protein [Candidatus Gracilibacteria bacterium]